MTLDRGNPGEVINAIRSERGLAPEEHATSLPSADPGPGPAVASSSWSSALGGPLVLAPDSAGGGIVVTGEAAAAAYVPTLDLAKQAKAGALYVETRELIEGRYADATQRTLTFMYAEALADAPAMPARAAHIALAWDWVNLVIDAYYVAIAAVLSATTAAAVAAVALDRATLLAADPLVSITTARAITG